jgi:hypothetical protein
MKNDNYEKGGCDMRDSTKYPFRYTWAKLFADAFWLTVLLTLLIKIIEGLT